ncbi:cobyric acid synthase CobQ [Aestuariivirga litoralis]|uniref:Cobyric acid synthase n=1 Tax=Aestuariivirga litoralis TaxID=2650924 RepID=A0A2W2AT20_9HYPH|nr:cobyric acid synthase [Aestuariivirga litoralis]PZF76792.1 cobyric acid synthase CobQ [Aestuariivirga litoralis]
MTRAIMFMGTGSDVGKSLIVAGLARAFANRGLRVQPFKPQNMSNNAAVTADGGEIGRAQALQARAARVPPSVHMNPILLKPETTTGAQVIVQGKRQASMTAREYFRSRMRYMDACLESFYKVAAQADLVLVEGAGSPGEINLRNGDLANMGFAEAADLPAVLIGDIHRGGVIASIAGTFDILPPEDRARLKAFLINKFHGDPELFSEGRSFLEQRTGTPCVGIVPHFEGARSLPAEDAVALEDALTTTQKGVRISVLRLPRIANFDDLDPLRLEAGVTLTFVQPGEPIPADSRLVIIPGSKSTVSDLAALRKEGWDIDLLAHVRRGGLVLGLCGGYQMLGKTIADPQGLEAEAGLVPGLGLLDVETTLLSDKTLTRIGGTHVPTGAALEGYEIHLGKTAGADCARPFALLGGRPDGAISASGQVMGSYLHGCFGSDAFRSKFLESLGVQASELRFEETVERVLDQLAAHLEAHLDLDLILSLAREF